MIDDGPGWHNAQKQALLLARGLFNRGHKVSIACRPAGELSRRAASESIPIYELSMRTEWDALAAWRLGALSAETDIIHANTFHTHTIALMAVRIGSMRPIVSHRRSEIESSQGHFARWKTRTTDRFIASSKKASAKLKLTQVPESKIRVVRDGVDFKEIETTKVVDPRSILGIDPSTTLIGSIGFPALNNSNENLLNALPILLSSLPEARFIFLDSGQPRDELRRKISEMGLADKVHILGGRNDALSIIKSFDLLVSAGDHEDSAESILDSFSAGIPVVASESDQAMEIIKDGFNGRIAKGKESKALAETIIEAIKDKKNSLKMSDAALNTVLTDYNADRMVESIIGIYSEIVRA